MANIVRKVSLIMADIDNNNNKVWYGTLFDDNSVLTEWGRVGKNMQSKHFPNAGSSFLDKKEREKRKKGYDTLNVVEGSEHVKVSSASSSRVDNSGLKAIAKKQIKHSNPLVASLIDYLTQQNAHNIVAATGGGIVYNDTTGLFSTPLGVITQDNIDEANDILVSVGDLVADNDYGQKLKAYSNRYLMLVPTDIGMKRFDMGSFWRDLQAVQKQKQILDSLQASLVSATSQPVKKAVKKDEPHVFDVQLDLIDDPKIVKKINDKYTKGRNRMHQSYNLSVKKVYAVNIAGEREAFKSDGATMENIWQLWHGTATQNVLSILKQGLIIPPSSSSHVTGRLYGDGVYASDQSTKALNYAVGYWGGRSANRTFMFLLDMAMGKMYKPVRRSYMSTRYPVKGYDSTFAEAGSGVMNNEMIAYRTSQVQLKYLVEFG